MRKNRTKHEAKKPRLAKRALALCFALIFVCSCLLPVFAHSEENLLTQEAVAQQESVDNPTEGGEDPALLNEGGTDSAEGNEQDPPANNPTEGGTKPTEGNEQPKNEGTTESKDSTEEHKPEGTTEESKGTTEETKPEGTTGESKDIAGETKPEEPKTEGTTEESKDSTEEPKPEEPKTEETKPTTNTTGDAINQGEATYTYRFWPDKIDEFTLEAIDDAVKKGESLNEAAQSKAGMVPCTVLTVMKNAHLSDYSVTEPTKDGYEFKGWYTIENGTNYDFSLDQNVNDIEESKTIDVFAKWEKVESTVEDEMEKTEPTTEDELDKTEPGKANESKDETLLPVEGAVGLMNNEGDIVSIAVKAENLPGKVNKLVVTDLNDDDEGEAFGNAFAASDYADWNVTNLMVNITPKDAEGNAVEPNGAVTVHFSGLESLMIQYSSEMNLKVLHVKRDGTLEALSLKNVQTKETKEGTVLSSFAVSTTSFSPFVLAASESASVEPAKLTLGAYPNYNKTLTVDESIVIKSDQKDYSKSWSTSDENALDIVGTGIDSDGYPFARVKAKKTTSKEVKIKYGRSSYTFSIADSRDDQTADIFFLKTPGSGADKNEASYWLPQYWKDGNWQSTTNWKVEKSDGTKVAMDGTVNTARATWDDRNKNIVLNGEGNSATMVRSWPDGSTESTWTLYRDCSTVTDKRDKDLNQQVFLNVLSSIWDTYQTELATDLGVSADTLQQSQITQITLTPYKISSNDSMHIDCTISATGIAYTARFWVEEPGETSYKQVYSKNYANNVTVKKPTDQNMVDWVSQNGNKVSLIKNKRGLPENVEEHGVTYRFAGWYPEGNPDTTPNLHHATVDFGRDGYAPSPEEKQNGVVNFYARYVADNQGKLDQNPYITVEKQIIGLPSDKVDDLLKTFKVNVGGNVLTCNRNSYDFTREDKDDDKTTILRWKIDDVVPGSYHVTEDGYTVNGYTLKAEDMAGNGEWFNVKEATFDANAEVFTPNNVNDFEVGTIGEQYWVFVISLTSSRNVVISNRTLSAKERASIIKAVADKNKAIGNNSTPDRTDFYSITENQEIELTDKKNTYKIRYNDYNPEVHGPGIHIEHTSNWNMVAKVNYSLTDAKSADIKLTNKYTPATTSLTVSKTATKDGVEDTTTDFNFTLTLGSKSENVTWRKSSATGGATGGKVTNKPYTFTLKGGESIIFSGISVEDTNVKVEETNYSAQHYTTTIKVNGEAVNEAAISAETLKQHQEAGTKVEFTNAYTTPRLSSMTIKKVVTGAFGERTKEFAFSVTLENRNSDLLNDVTATGAATKDNLGNFTMKHGKQVTLENIPINTTITITETGADDYKTKATGHNGYVSGNNARTFTYTVVEEGGKAVLKSTGASAAEVANSAITVENNFDGTPDTGVLLDTLPYLILLAVAVAGGVLVVVRKRKHRDE